MVQGIKRRRIRSAVDPCLGYYTEKGTRNGMNEAAHLPSSSFNVTQASRPEIHKPSHILRAQARKEHRDDLAQVTVEDFLRSNSKKSVTRSKPFRAAPIHQVGYRVAHFEEHADDTLPARSPSPASSIEFQVSPMARPGLDLILEENNQHRPQPEGEASSDDLDNDHEDSDKDSLPDIAVLKPCPRSESEDSESPRKVLSLRTRNVRRRRVILATSDSESDGEASDFGKLTPPAHRAQKKVKSKKLRTKSLGARLFEACAATGGQPSDSLVVPPPPENATHRDALVTQRKPLRFALEEDHDDEPQDPASYTPAAPRRRVLVDPRRFDHLRHASFCGSKVLAQPPVVGDYNVPHRNLPNWKSGISSKDTARESPERKTPQRKRGRRKGGARQVTELAYRPLEFVPLSEFRVDRKT